MQPFDALTIRAVLFEAKPLLLNRRVDKVYQVGRDEILLCLRGKAGMANLFISAQNAYGRICLVRLPSATSVNDKVSKRYEPAPKSASVNSAGGSPSSFNMIMRKYLTGATLVAIEQPVGERTVDFIFSCIDEVGGSSHKILTVEIMGRHSNLILWDKNGERILTASHLVTKDMSRQREIAPGLKFVRPPEQEKANIFTLEQEAFLRDVGNLQDLLATDAVLNGPTPIAPATIEQWLMATYTGLGRHLAEELVDACGLESKLTRSSDLALMKDKLWEKIAAVQGTGNFMAYMRQDLSRYSVLGWWRSIEKDQTWKHFPAVNDLAEEYFRLIETREQFQQMKERLLSELKLECEKLEVRLAAVDQQLQAGEDPSELKKRGDLVLANLHMVTNGQELLVCPDLFDPSNGNIEIKLNANMTASQNAQHFYRLFAKHRARQSAATVARREATARLAKVNQQLAAVSEAKETAELRELREGMFGRKHETKSPHKADTRKKTKSKLLQLTSSDGWTIYVGRNRYENDYLLTRMAQPSDIWLHILGQGGAHVLIRVPASKQDPPMTTLREAAQIAARMSKAGPGSKQRVVYTQCRYVKKVVKEKPGLVRYEHEKTLEVDTGLPAPAMMKEAFSDETMLN